MSEILTCVEWDAIAWSINDCLCYIRYQQEHFP